MKSNSTLYNKTIEEHSLNIFMAIWFFIKSMPLILYTLITGGKVEIGAYKEVSEVNNNLKK